MNLKICMLEHNDCYLQNQRQRDERCRQFQQRGPVGIMVHSTGANNPYVHRYVGPDDGILGPNPYGNHWNQPGTGVCVHAFIGKAQDGSVVTYQTLPWNYRGWHCGRSGNNTHVAFEICEDGLDDPEYFHQVYQEAAELCAYLCKKFHLTEKNILCHSEGYQQGIASNHADVMHWFPRFGKSMDSFRAEVAAMLAPKPYALKDFIRDVQQLTGSVADGIAGPETIRNTITLSCHCHYEHDLVEPVQRRLTVLGYDPGKIDGIYGRQTAAAVEDYQADNGCIRDGIITKRNRTWRHLLGME